ncbi:MAG TPA: glycerol kinase GlpK [Acidimicrobiales bacterium]|nr:glycerol kinase GlpK [Acidimicrobiales bacterium]
MDLILALDAGTTGIRSVAFDQHLRVVDEEYRELTQFFPSPGEVEHDALEIAQLAVATLDAVAQRVRSLSHRVIALGIANQRETTVGFDRDSGEPLCRAIVWQDRRTSEMCQRLDAEGHGPLVRERTGLVLDAYFSATKMRWMLERGLADGARIPAFATVDTWLVWVLSGGVDQGQFLTDPSNASRTCLLDLTSRAWSSEMLDLFGVERSMLADVRASNAHFASVNADILPSLAGVPITGVLGDQQSALFGQACFEVGMVKATYGTGAFVLAQAGERVPAVIDGLITTVAWQLDESRASYALEGSAFVAGAAIQWLAELGVIEASRDLEALARSVNDSAGAQFVPAFTGLWSPFWRAGARGAISGLSQGVGRGQIARALVEALAYQVRAMTDAFVAGGVVPHELRCDGGAAAMDLLLELQATNSRTSVLRSSTLEATARGAASMAGLGAGVFGSLEELSDLWHASARFEPGDPLFVDAGYAAWMRALERT